MEWHKIIQKVIFQYIQWKYPKQWWSFSHSSHSSVKHITRSNGKIRGHHVSTDCLSISPDFSLESPMGPGPRRRSLGITGTLPAAAGGRPGAGRGGWVPGTSVANHGEIRGLSMIVLDCLVGWCWLILVDVGWWVGLVGWVGWLVGLCNGIFYNMSWDCLMCFGHFMWDDVVSFNGCFRGPNKDICTGFLDGTSAVSALATGNHWDQNRPNGDYFRWMMSQCPYNWWIDGVKYMVLFAQRQDAWAAQGPNDYFLWVGLRQVLKPLKPWESRWRTIWNGCKQWS